jgi:hypothetical protein
MSNSGRIGGHKSTATHKMRVQKQKIEQIDDSCNNRAARRAYSAMARKNKPILDEASLLAVKLFNGDVVRAKDWLYTEQEGSGSPLEKILLGHGAAVIAQLKDLLEHKV